MDEYIVGLNIGSSSVCTAAGKLDKYGKIQIVGINYVPCTGIKKGVVIDIDETSEGIKTSIYQLQTMIDAKVTEVYLSIPAEICEIILNKGVVAVSSDDREIKKNDVSRALNASRIITIPSNKEIIGVIPEEYIVDGYNNIKDPIGMSGVRLEVDAQIILSESTIISNLLKCIKKSGLIVKGMVFQPMANAVSVLKEEETETGVLLLDAGAETTNMTVFKEGKVIYQDKISIGGNMITNDISLCLNIPMSEAEKVKLKYGKINLQKEEDFKIKVNASYDNTVEISYNILNEIISFRVEELLSLVKKKLVKNEQMANISSIVIVGGGIALLKGVNEIGKDIMDKSTRVGMPEYIGTASPLYSSAVGVVEDVLNTLKANPIDEDNKEFNKKREKYNRNEEEIFYEEEKEGIISKIKEFFLDFF
ncbi:cell division protein FtsA [Clostridium tetani]|uniref:cell division protein FtsA n=1 Tax=Clostridium tetani TaxID=1513 RepID=UPI00100A38F8|nr:cell division protein FtsA [Clostridium tetani]RXI44223.1 cell division protein FtsA [Clostridium tetani]RXI55025.1 cell division protein FtsA [Clostridium tetani]RXI55302.1 cell division protein FtsA [Clostridium tetani]RXM59657.1 cell division protein FtsA [Clostridium tetani]RXM65110.1 cell division protein FtsA [Clostridium tetani]